MSADLLGAPHYEVTFDYGYQSYLIGRYATLDEAQVSARRYERDNGVRVTVRFRSL